MLPEQELNWKWGGLAWRTIIVVALWLWGSQNATMLEALPFSDGMGYYVRHRRVVGKDLALINPGDISNPNFLPTSRNRR